MTGELLQALWKRYQDAWADISMEERDRLLRASVTEDVIFTSPNGEGQGRANLFTHIAAFQRQFSGAYFRSHRLTAQHSQLLSEWTMFDSDGSEFLTGHSYARFDDEEGRLQYLAGFWKL